MLVFCNPSDSLLKFSKMTDDIGLLIPVAVLLLDVLGIAHQLLINLKSFDLEKSFE